LQSKSHEFRPTLHAFANDPSRGIILFLIVGLKEAFVAGLAISHGVFCKPSAWLYGLGGTLNSCHFSRLSYRSVFLLTMLSWSSLLRSILNTGKFTPEEAVLLVLNDFKWVLTTTTLATVWAFRRSFLQTGIIGEYLKSIRSQFRSRLLPRFLLPS